MVPKVKKNFLWLVWKDVNTRERFVVGRLSWDGDKFCFEYIDDEGDNNLTKAMERGFELLPAFPSLYEEYTSSNLFLTFANRLPDRSRKDVLKLFERKELSPNCSDIQFLALTGGRLPTDNLEFVQEIESEEKEFSLRFYVAGVRYYFLGKERHKVEGKLTAGNNLLLKNESTNQYDSHAIEVLTLEGEKLGYIPVFYSRYLDREVEQGHCNTKVVTFDKEADFNEMLEVEVSGKSLYTDVIESLDMGK